MREIAEAAGVGKSTSCDYFPEKDNILLFVLEQEMAKRNRAAAEKVPPPFGRAHERNSRSKG